MKGSNDMPKKIFSTQEKKEIIELYTIQKMSSKALGQKYGCSHVTLLKNLKEWGIEPNQRKLDLTNQKFGKLMVLKPASKRDDKYTRWVCQCECGNITEVRTDYLTNGHTTSCGCEKNKFFQKTVILGQKYGKLIPIVYDEIKQQYLCKCDCGNTTYVKGYNLNNGNTQSCGCLKSKGEFKIITLLTELGINFQTQYQFNDCRFPNTNRMAYFDFAIFNDNNELLMVIEYDGTQHEYGWSGQENSLNLIKERDNFKEQYCLLNNISLKRISHKDYNKIDKDYLINLVKQEVTE